MFCGKHDEEEIFNVPNAAGMEKWTQDSEICDLMGSVVISDYTLNKKCGISFFIIIGKIL